MEALGRLFNVQYVMDDVYVNLKDCAGVTFVCYIAGGAGDTYTLTEAKTAAGGSSQVLATITRRHYCTGDGVTDSWTLATQVAASTAVSAAVATQNMQVVEVDAVELSAGYDFVKLTSTGAGLVVAITRDLYHPRKPANLAIMGA